MIILQPDAHIFLHKPCEQLDHYHQKAIPHMLVFLQHIPFERSYRDHEPTVMHTLPKWHTKRESKDSVYIIKFKANILSEMIFSDSSCWSDSSTVFSFINLRLPTGTSLFHQSKSYLGRLC